MSYLYIQQFERANFEFEQPLRQTADVLFRSDLADTDENIAELEEQAYAAMWQQNPHWKNYDGPLEEYGGWSSVLTVGGRRLVEEQPLEDLGTPGEGKPRIGEIFVYKNDPTRRYRVEGFYKEFVRKPRKDAILDEIFQDIEARKSPEQKAREAKLMKVVGCSRDEATFVSGAGVAGTVARLEDIEIIGLVEWKPRTIQRYRQAYRYDDDSFPVEIYRYWADEVKS